MTGEMKNGLRPVSSDKLVRCEACGEMFLRTSFEGGFVLAYGCCRECHAYFEGLQKLTGPFDLQT
jgi:ribosomal protein L31